MRNFTELEKQKLITQIWKAHDEIFSLPAKRYVFSIINPIIGSGATFGYDYLNIKCEKNITTIKNFGIFDKFNFKFGDRLIIVYCESNLDGKNDFIFKKGSIDKNLPNHDSIIIHTDFFNQSEFSMLYRETIMAYQYKNKKIFPHISGIYAFEYIVKNLEKNHEKH